MVSLKNRTMRRKSSRPCLMYIVCFHLGIQRILEEKYNNSFHLMLWNCSWHVRECYCLLLLGRGSFDFVWLFVCCHVQFYLSFREYYHSGMKQLAVSLGYCCCIQIFYYLDCHSLILPSFLWFPNDSSIVSWHNLSVKTNCLPSFSRNFIALMTE